MTKEEWEELETLDLNSGDRYDELLKKTMKEDEHPWEYDGPCLCQLCLSYGD